MALNSINTNASAMLALTNLMNTQNSLASTQNIISTGKNVGIRYRGGGHQAVYGATIVNELHNDGSTNLEGDIRGNASLLFSKEALDLVQNLLSRRLVTTSSWTDQ